jgi:hypothetical protein
MAREVEATSARFLDVENVENFDDGDRRRKQVSVVEKRELLRLVARYRLSKLLADLRRGRGRIFTAVCVGRTASACAA